MMRSLYSGVAGLKTHQTKMDVIGNNIANVNTVGFKSSSVNFSDTFYQTMSSASGPNAEMATAGTNAKQIGLGSTVASITTNITEQGGTSTTNRAMDIAINGESFLIVRSGTDTLFTKSGALNVDQAGNLYCTTNGATVQGWLADDNGDVIKDTVKDLAIMTPDKLYYPPEATGAVTLSGNVDPNDKDLTGTGEVMTFSFYDSLGDSYSVKMSVKYNTSANGTVSYDVTVEDVVDSNSNSIFVYKEIDASGAVTYKATGAEINFGGTTITCADLPAGGATGTNTIYVDPQTGKLTPTGITASTLLFSSSTGDFVSATGASARTDDNYKDKAINFSITKYMSAGDRANTTQGATRTLLEGAKAGTGGTTVNETPFVQYNSSTDQGGINIYFDSLTQYSTGGTSKLSSAKGTVDGYETGNTAGNMKGISISDDGKIYGTYDNGMKKCLGQIAVATFSNPSGLEAVGDSLFAASLNSGEFDGVGEDVKLSGSLTVGALEMSNVDLANEFTQMITTQRGFQANSRIITTSDSMLEELVNLKR